MTVRNICEPKKSRCRIGCPVSIWSTAAAPTCPIRTRCFRTAIISAASSTISPNVRAGIAQIAVVMGSCTAGGAYVPAMSDETMIVRGQGTIFLARPALGESRDRRRSCRRGIWRRRRALPHHPGVADHYAENDAHALGIARGRGRDLNTVKRPRRWRPANPVPPRYRRARTSMALSKPTAARPSTCSEIIARLVDSSEFDEFKRLYGATLVMRFRAYLGISRSGSSPTTASCSPKAHRKARISSSFARNAACPVVFLQNITGFMVGKKYEAGGIAKDGAKMVTAVATTAVPKFTIIIGGSFGAGNYGMCGRAYSPRFLWMWPNARISVMGGEQAASVLASVRREASKRAAAVGRRRRKRRSRAPIRVTIRRCKDIPTIRAPGFGTTAMIDPCAHASRARARAVG